jgi:hypothetical protein
MGLDGASRPIMELEEMAGCLLLSTSSSKEHGFVLTLADVWVPFSCKTSEQVFRNSGIVFLNRYKPYGCTSYEGSDT